ncbi:ubiquitin-like protein Pup [Alloscardovia theropitheci]|nr:ubiquitin-like protein Pup [Alloscardovia theropitheci]
MPESYQSTNDFTHNSGSAQSQNMYTSHQENNEFNMDNEQIATQGSDQFSEAISDLDSVLDDIEASLEENAEEYVNSFVQKGGQ